MNLKQTSGILNTAVQKFSNSSALAIPIISSEKLSPFPEVLEALSGCFPGQFSEIIHIAHDSCFQKKTLLNIETPRKTKI